MSEEFQRALLLAAWFGLPMGAQAGILTYPAPAGAPETGARYQVEIRQGRGDWRRVPVYCFFRQYVYNWSKTAEPHLAYFDSEGPVEVRILVKPPFDQVTIRPLSRKVPRRISGNEITVTMTDSTRQLIIEPDGDPFHALLLFTNPMEREVPPKDDPNVLYYGPGYHRAGAIEIADKERPYVYIAGGAVVEGSLALKRCRNIRIGGRGILFTPKDFGSVPLLVDHCSGGTVDNLMVLSRDENWTFWYHGSDSIRVKDVKVVGEVRDGINIINSNHVHITNCYSQSHDDCLCVKGNIWSKVGVEKILVEHCILNNIAGGNGMDIGHDLDAPYVRDLVFRDIDIIHNLHPEGIEAFESYPTAAIAIHPTTDVYARNAEVVNALYEDIRIEDNRDQWMIDIWTLKPGFPAIKGVTNVVFRNVRKVAGEWRPIRIYGNENAIIRNVVFEDVYDENRILDGKTAGDVEKNAFVKDCYFTRVKGN